MIWKEAAMAYFKVYYHDREEYVTNPNCKPAEKSAEIRAGLSLALQEATWYLHCSDASLDN
jgi:hypothetical protein